MTFAVGGEIGGISGDWRINTGLVKKDIYTKASIKESNEKHLFKDGSVNSVKVVRSAISNIVSLRGFFNSKSDDRKSMYPGFFVIDENGKCLNYNYLNQSVSNDNGAFETDISIMSISKDSKKLTIIPFQRVSSKEKRYITELGELPAKIIMPESEISVFNANKGNGKFFMNYAINGFTDHRRSTYFNFYDKSGNEIEQANNDGYMKPMDYETGIGTYEFTTSNPENISKVACSSFENRIMKEFKFDVELK